jgi:hypothetical protein
MGELMNKGSCTNENLDFFALDTPLNLMKLVTKTLCKICGEWNFHWKCDVVAHLVCPSCIFTQTFSFGNKSTLGYFDIHSDFSLKSLLVIFVTIHKSQNIPHH